MVSEGFCIENHLKIDPKIDPNGSQRAPQKSQKSAKQKYTGFQSLPAWKFDMNLREKPISVIFL